jgi:hypothetical protein
MVLKAGDHFRQDAMIKELAGPVQPQVYMWRSFVHRTTAS